MRRRGRPPGWGISYPGSQGKEAQGHKPQEARPCHLHRTPTSRTIQGPPQPSCFFCPLQAGHIDAVTLSSEDIYMAGKTYGLVPAAGERYAPEDKSNSYFVVAVVKRDSSHAFTLDELRGKRSCHASFGSPAGWDIPVGVLIRRGFIRPKDCDILTAVSAFFNASCVPVNNAKNYPSSLCALCVGDEQGRNKCAGNSQERYYGYSGAFRCLVENAGDVAFVRHTTVFDNTNGHNSEPWAAELRSEDYELLCPNGARAEVSQFVACNLAQIPPHAVMVRPDTNIFTVYGLLDKAQDLFGDDYNKNGFKMFDSSNYHGQDLLFKDATVRAVPAGEKTTYRDWLGLDYVAALEGMLSQQCSGAGSKGKKHCNRIEKWEAGARSVQRDTPAPLGSVPQAATAARALGPDLPRSSPAASATGARLLPLLLPARSPRQSPRPRRPAAPQSSTSRDSRLGSFRGCFALESRRNLGKARPGAGGNRRLPGSPAAHGLHLALLPEAPPPCPRGPSRQPPPPATWSRLDRAGGGWLPRKQLSPGFPLPEGPASLLPAAMRPRARGLLGTRWPLRHQHPEGAARPSEEARPRAPSGPSPWDRGPCWRERDGEREAGPGRLGETHKAPPPPSCSGRSLRQWDLVGGRELQSLRPPVRWEGGRPRGISVCPAGSPTVAAPAPSRASCVHGTPS
ncbi:hypothetical protein P7K49_030215 [Saguinus oedipus]|uniref:Melanotransferrin n=1 Tax=Saguinus oedipus TaxID=9490 RepID=A0ABQ9U1L2_SAGOE|nr:hypothetical protein P7K49_030215 [Saguinus oedipus]